VNIPFGTVYEPTPNDGKRHLLVEADSLTKRGLAKPGVVIEVDGSEYLIGDINTLGGVCDDCADVRSHEIVTRYKVVYP